MLVDPSSDRPLYKQLADLIRIKINDGEFAPGQRLPAQGDYVQEHHLSRDTVDRAMMVLRNEGLIVTARGGSRVRPPVTPTILPLRCGKISARMPTERERNEHHINDGVPVFVIKRDGPDEIYPADRFEIKVDLDTCDGEQSQ
jgi:DNA-binding transcriptional regulator YhcF (GntR family)